MKLNEKIIELLEDTESAMLIECINDYFEHDYDNTYVSFMDEFESYVECEHILDIINRVDDFNTCDNYFYEDDHGYYQSNNNLLDIVDNVSSLDDFIEYLIEYHEVINIFELDDVIEEYQEEEEE